MDLKREARKRRAAKKDEDTCKTNVRQKKKEEGEDEEEEKGEKEKEKKRKEKKKKRARNLCLWAKKNARQHDALCESTYMSECERV